jgi:hypothetical protein
MLTEFSLRFAGADKIYHVLKCVAVTAFRRNDVHVCDILMTQIIK